MAIGIPGQSRAGPVATGQAYAQSIAGGMPMEQIIAPGVSYSPEQAGGYTQADLDFIAKGPAPVMPIAPTTGEVAIIEDQMPYAPPGVTQPTPFPAVGNFDFLTGLDFSNLPDFSDIDFSNIEIDAALQEYSDRIDAGEPEPIESFFTEPSQVPVMPQIPAYQEPVNFTDFSPVENTVPFEDKNVFELRQETESMVNPYNQLPGNDLTGLFNLPDVPQPTLPAPYIVGATPRPNGISPVKDPTSGSNAIGPAAVAPINIPNIPMNFTGLPNMPVMPQIPQTTYIPPASSFIQPRVEEIVSPISRGRTRQLPQPGLFNLV